jgi:poly-beta-1,6-N-acetyl-D-glucosamine synthase
MDSIDSRSTITSSPQAVGISAPPLYVLITPVRNEEATIGVTIESIVRQTILPKEWVIVSDESTDRTDEIVRSYAAKYGFIRFVRLKSRPQRNFASMVFTVETGIAALETKNFAFLGFLDADIRLHERYYESILRQFTEDPQLGVAGGLVVDIHADGQCKVSQDTKDVAGGVQFFRRTCFESVGGILPIPEGGFDVVMCVQARMHGFKTRTFREIQVDHLKPRNAAEGKFLRRIWQFGIREYARGNHPLFQLLKCGQLCIERPFVIRAAVQFGAYAWCYLSRRKRILSADLIRFIHREQLARLPLLRSWFDENAFVSNRILRQN